MRNDSNAPVVRPPAISPSGVLFCYSPNLALRVRYGSLDIDLGRGRTLSVSRAGEPKLRRLVLCGFGGWMTLAVPEWVAGIGASWMHLDLTGRILGQGPGDTSPNLPAVRRAQALASGTNVGLTIGRDLLAAKVGGQAANLRRLPGMGNAASTIEDAIGALDGCDTSDQLRVVEAQAAATFWAVLAELPFAFVAPDEPKVPPSWRKIGRRASYVTGAPRGASSPAHAAWNFAYSLAASEVEIALRGSGLDPGISPTGLHADTPSRSSATFDVLEAIRGVVDDLLLSIFAERRFRRREFVQQPDGRVRLTAPLARELAEAVLPVVRDAAAPVAESVARMLADSATGAPSQLARLPTNMTGDGRSRGRDGIRRSSRKVTDVARLSRSRLAAACRRCGIAFEGSADRDRRLCDDCHKVASAEQRAAFAAAGPAALARICQDEGRYPVQRTAVRERIGRSQSARRLADLAWDAQHPQGIDRGIFDEALPGLRALPLRAIAQATGLSLTAARAIRGGKPPHPRHWGALRSITLREHPPPDGQ